MVNTVQELPDQLDPGETLELTLTVNTPTGTQTVTLSQTLAGDETLQDAAEGLVEDLLGGADDFESSIQGQSGTQDQSWTWSVELTFTVAIKTRPRAWLRWQLTEGNPLGL